MIDITSDDDDDMIVLLYLHLLSIHIFIYLFIYLSITGTVQGGDAEVLIDGYPGNNEYDDCDCDR